ncbi:extracellular elastinolytic metallo proteinase [Crepidotus variabilis]|uniref:Extracellular metalloproteinase n=1 Tax=Crepidotus variabilis TaxID=179855 RepID=A0A9P6JLL5_9AGAR|nr:extracellular elastinolytic metallo proteinase [Crepidotus variabilis]
MRCFFTAPLVVASLAGYVYGHRHATPSIDGEGHTGLRRKTLGFGPAHPHAVFRSSPYQIQTNGFVPVDSVTDPLEVARLFVEDVMLGKEFAEGSSKSYKIRKDSYTDKATGVTHVYVRQLVNGLEVADGDMNINVKDGMVISYGNSFYNGAAPQPYVNLNADTARDVRGEACDALFTSIRSLRHASVVDSEQLPMGSPSASHIPELIALADANCQPRELPDNLSSDDDFRPALLKFMATATPSTAVATDILENFENHRDAMEVTPVNHLTHDEGEQPFEFTVDNVPDAVNPVKAKLAYIQVPNAAGDGTELQLVWKFEVEMQDNWYETSVSASAPHNIISVVDWASDSYVPIPKVPDFEGASYNVFPWGINDPECGDRSVEKENDDSLASPAGWHAIPTSVDPYSKSVRSASKGIWRNTTTTWGNNVFAQENWEGQNAFINNYRPEAGSEKKFHFKYNPKETEKPDAMDEAQKYINTTISQLFYTTNMVHDLYYRYGFDELAGNFQQYNFGRGGAESDAVIANAQDGSGFNNANFMTPPDGQNGRMRMYLWNTALPYRDGDLEAGIVIHELTHGLSTRLTGGPANSGCLGWGESGGMGEGWGDFLATMIRNAEDQKRSKSKWQDRKTHYAMGSWAANRENGIRNYPYSRDTVINPSSYKTLDKPGYWGVHAIGEVWAEILWVVAQELIDKHGFSETLYPPTPLANGTIPAGDFYREPASSLAAKPLIPIHGNTLAVQLVINGMKLQPCRPSFFEARDAIIQADEVLTGGENYCDLWKGFAKRGLGVDAKVINRTPWGGGIRSDGLKPPRICEDSE